MQNERSNHVTMPEFAQLLSVLSMRAGCYFWVTEGQLHYLMQVDDGSVERGVVLRADALCHEPQGS